MFKGPLVHRLSIRMWSMVDELASWFWPTWMINLDDQPSTAGAAGRSNGPRHWRPSTPTIGSYARSMTALNEDSIAIFGISFQTTHSPY